MWDDVKSSCTADSLFNATPPAIVRLCHQTILGITKHGGISEPRANTTEFRTCQWLKAEGQKEDREDGEKRDWTTS